MNVIFLNVGAQQRTWAARSPQHGDLDWLFCEVRRGGLTADDIEFCRDGSIRSFNRVVGEFLADETFI